MKKAIVMTLCAAMAVGMIGTVSTVYAAEADITSDDAIKKAADEGWEIAVVPKDSTNPWFVRMDTGVKEVADETGVNCYQIDTGTIDATKQAQLVEDLIAQGVDAICVVPVDMESMDSTLKKAKDAGIVVITHEGADLTNVDYDIEAFSNEGYGAFIMQNLAEAMGEEGVYTTMVASLTNGSHNEWADAAVEYQKEHYPNMTLLEDNPRVESDDNGDTAYNVAKELIKTYPDLKGIIGFSSPAPIGAGQAVSEMGLQGKVAVVGTCMPNDANALMKEGAISSGLLWDPAALGYLSVGLAKYVLDGNEIKDGDVEIQGYGTATIAGKQVFMGDPLIFTAETVDNYNF